MLVLDILRSSFYSFAFKRDESTVKQAMILRENIAKFDYDAFCKSTLFDKTQQISSEELNIKLIKNGTVQLIDIREEFYPDSIGGSINIPMSSLDKNINRINKDMDVIIYCDFGMNSIITTKYLSGLGFDNVYNLMGGIEAWKNYNLNKK